MLQTIIPKDIRKYDTKFIGPFTFRQTILFVIASIIAILVWKVTKIIPIALIASSPFLALGWIKVYGQELEKFLKSAFISNLLAPAVRKYKTKTPYRVCADSFERTKQEKSKIRQRNLLLSKKNDKYKPL